MIEAACPECHGSGELRRHVLHRVSVIQGGRAGLKLMPVRCSRCGGSGYLAPRRLHYLAARRCACCARPYSPPATAPGLALQLCSFCLDRRRGTACLRCGAALVRSATGRPPLYCPAHSSTRRSYAADQARRDVAGRLEPSGRDLDESPGLQEGDGNDGNSSEERAPRGEGDRARRDPPARSGHQEVAAGRSEGRRDVQRRHTSGRPALLASAAISR